MLEIEIRVSSLKLELLCVKFASVIKLIYFPVFFFVVSLVLLLRLVRFISSFGVVLAVATVMGNGKLE